MKPYLEVQAPPEATATPTGCSQVLGGGCSEAVSEYALIFCPAFQISFLPVFWGPDVIKNKQ